MRFKTTIEIISEAEDKNDAVEIAGEYLSGNLVSGIDMKCRTKRIRNYRKGAAVAAAILFFLIIGAISLTGIKPSQNLISHISGTSAIQTPLKTSETEKKDSDFKKAWQAIRAKEALNYLKK